MIGSGIFIVSAESARLTGSALGLLAVWSLAGLLTWLATLNAAELAVMLPAAGGPYVYFREGFGELPAFLFAWSMALVVQSGTIAAVAAAFARFLGVLLPQVEGLRAQLVAVAVIAILTLANARGVRTGTTIQNLLTLTKYAALLLLTIGGLLLAVPPHGASLEPAVSTVSPGLAVGGWLAFATALVGPLFSQSAWSNVTFPAGEIADPHRTLPRALIGGGLLVALLYMLTNVAYLRVIGFDGITHAVNDRVGSAVAERLWPHVGGSAMAIAILISTFGCVNGLILSGARVISAAGAGGVFPTTLMRLNRFGVPGWALLAQGVWCSLLVMSGTYSQLLKYVIAVELLIVIALVLAVPVLRRRRPDFPRPFRTPGYPWTTGIFLLLATTVAALLAWSQPPTTVIAYLIVVGGIPIYLLFRHRPA